MRLLVGVDETEQSAAALQWAVGLARDIQQLGLRRDGLTPSAEHVVVAKAWMYPSFPLLAESGSDAEAEATDAKVLLSLRHFAEQALEKTDPTALSMLEFVALRGKATSALIQYAQDRHTDLIVLGTRRLDAVERRFPGSVGRTITEQAPCDVAIVPLGSEARRGPIVVGVDSSENSRLLESRAAELAPSLSRDGVVLVHCSDYGSLVPSNAGLPISFAELSGDLSGRVSDTLGDELRAQGIHYRTVLTVGDPGRGLCNVADNERARFLMVGAHSESKLKRMLFGGVGSYVTGHADVPVMVVRQR
jgi:nucleotide-binding universal stress UspA family protein